jgi:tRNA 2-selenouridine synthase
MPIERINISQLFDYQLDSIIIDVRTPAEFEQGHIVGAFNLPLFTDEERAIVGTAYKRQSPQNALIKGLDLVGKKLSYFIKRAQKMAQGKRIIVHCWRGGKRSGSMAWLLDLAGMNVVVLEGGYKAYRTHVQASFELPLSLNVLGGATGTGKTEVLFHLNELNAQVVDLEGLANHKGSAFGALGEDPQPKTEHFENLLFNAIGQLDRTKTIWIENESRGIGTAFLPQGFWDNMKIGKLINIEIPYDLRVARSVEDYKKYPKEDLIAVFKNIERKLGGQHSKAAIAALENDDYRTAAEIALVYYDKTYQHSFENNPTLAVSNLSYSHADMKEIARDLLEKYK